MESGRRRQVQRVRQFPSWLRAQRNTARPGTNDPHTRFEGRTGEQSTMFLLDPAGNALEFKSFANAGQLFAH